MSAPYVSQRRLVGNSISAMLAAIEAYNKPQIAYRDEITVILVVNAWELALKAALRQGGKTIYYPKQRGTGRYLTLSLDDAIRRVTTAELWPARVDGTACTANLKVLSEYRDRAIHLYNTEGLSNVIYTFLQQNVINYRDLILEKFKRDLADSITWQLLPLGATAPADAVQFMKVDKEVSMIKEVEQFLADLRSIMDETEKAGADMARLATVYDINLRSVKNMTSSDFVADVSSPGGKVVIRKIDPNQTYPFNMTQLIAKVNAKRKGKAINNWDYQAVCWERDIRNNSKYAWRHQNTNVWSFSGDAVSLFTSLTDEEYTTARRAYSQRPQ